MNLTTKRSDGSTVQNLSYVYDASGNVTNITDSAQQTVYFSNTVVDPSSSYIYDALDRIVQATGREHLGQVGATAPGPWDLDAGANGQDPRNGAAMARYTESYFYDLADNIQSVKHAGSAASTPGWTRTYNYAETSPLQTGVTNNRLSSTSVGSTISQYKYDGSAGVNGCMTSMSHLSILNWGFNDMIQATATQSVNNGTPETTYYQYDASNSRSRKVTNRQAQATAAPVRKSERIYLGAFEIYREFAANGIDITLERQSINLSDGTRQVVLAETRTQGTDNTPQQLMRYQFTNQIGSTCLELDEEGQIISYEEYYPFGSSSYQATGNQVEMPKRYRYTGKERDEENGLYYVGARYYACWLGRWTAADPAGLVDGTNLYHYSRNNPVRLKDPGGTQSQDPNAPLLQGFGLTLNGNKLQVGPLTTPPASAGCDELNPICRGLQFNLSGGTQLTPQLSLSLDAPFAGPLAKDGSSINVSSEKSRPADQAPDNDVGEPALLESLIPIWGSGRSAIHHFQKGNYVRGVLYTALAISDVFLVKSLVTAGGKLIFKTVAEAAAKEAAENVAKNAVVKTGQEVVHLTNPAAEVGIKESEKIGGRWGVFGLDASRAPTSNFGRNVYTLVPGNLSAAVPLSEEASKLFARPPLFGPLSTVRNLWFGVRAAPLGSVGLAGEFAAGEIYKGGVFRMATKGEYALQLSHQWLLDYGMDSGLYTFGKVGLYGYDLSTGDAPTHF